MSEPDNEVLVAPHEGVGAELDLNLSASTIPDDEYRASVSKTLLAGSRSRYRSGSQSSSSRPNSPSVSGHSLCPDPDPSLCPDPDPSPCTPPVQTLHLHLGPSLFPDPDPSPCTPPGQTLPLGHRIYSDPDPSP